MKPMIYLSPFISCGISVAVSVCMKQRWGEKAGKQWLTCQGGEQRALEWMDGSAAEWRVSCKQGREPQEAEEL